MSYTAYQAWRDRPITEPPWLSVVIPAFNEAERILPTVAAIAAHLSAYGRPWELIVSDDGSTDDTVERLQMLDMANLRVVQAPANAGKGAAVRRGVMSARGELILFADADNSTPIEEADLLLAAVDGGEAEVAIGSRAVAGAEEASKSLLRRILSGTSRALARRVLAVSLADTQCGFKLFRARVARDLFASQRIDGFAFDMEVLYLAARRGYRIAEIAVRWVDAPGSKVDPRREAARFLRDMARVRWNDLAGRYAREAQA